MRTSTLRNLLLVVPICTADGAPWRTVHSHPPSQSTFEQVVPALHLKVPATNDTFVPEEGREEQAWTRNWGQEDSSMLIKK